jgi:hypothetical protein
MYRKSTGTRSSKSAPNSTQRSAFEMSIHLETQDQTPQKGFAFLKAGDPCPQCQAAIIDYDSMLNLSCPDCGYTLAGCFT